ncbi:hypothetical protein KIN20_038280 [Parelaphostrongylus tenuis]|uniref:CSD domain-containing protein n=1 Tax=Parelaphostrongylus tenuis TaxID=148309 RepID=A0AAD5RF20_PARTN|nr:hypothetical protein KIN20_038280 [Parelaphostrongylus tenuis]
MSTISAEVADNVEAIEKKVEAMKVVDGNTMEVKKETTTTTTTDGKNDRRERRFARMTDEERRRIWEEEQMSKKVIETGLKGRVKWYSVLGHYGFISRADGKPDIFVHQSAIAKSQTEKFYLRPEASNVTGPGGGNVRGSKYQRVLLYRFRPDRRHIQYDKDGEKKSSPNGTETKVATDGEDVKKPLHDRRQGGRYFRPRRGRQPQGNGSYVMTPAKGTDTTANVGGTTNAGAPGFARRRINYYGRRFRRQKIEPKHGDGVNNENMNASNSSGTAAESGKWP